MNKEIKERIQTLLSQIKLLSENILKNLFSLGSKDINTRTIVSYTYSPTNDIIYIYCKDSYSGSLLQKELTEWCKLNEVPFKRIGSDQVNNMYIVELEFGNPDIIALNIEGKAKIKSIDNRYL